MKKGPLLIQQAAIGDLSKVEDLITIESTGNEDYSRLPEILLRKAIGNFSQYIFLIANSQGVDVGYSIGYMFTDDQDAMEKLFIHHVFVRIESRRQGIGYKLEKALIDYAGQRKVPRVCTSVTIGNDASLALQEKLGFAINTSADGHTANLDL